MVVVTRASVQRRHSSASSSKTGVKATTPRSASDDPQTLRPKRRSRSSTHQHSTKALADGPHEASGDNAISTSSISSRADLTWQQRDLLNQSRAKPRRSTRTEASTCAPTSSLPILRITRDFEIVTTTEVPQRSTRARRSLPSPKSLSHPQVHFTAANVRLAKRRLSAAAPASTAISQAYAEPSCFRAPLPQSLPLPCFSKSIKCVAVTAALT